MVSFKVLDLPLTNPILGLDAKNIYLQSTATVFQKLLRIINGQRSFFNTPVDGRVTSPSQYNVAYF